MAGDFTDILSVAEVIRIPRREVGSLKSFMSRRLATLDVVSEWDHRGNNRGDTQVGIRVLQGGTSG